VTVAIVGAAGQLGQDLCRLLGERAVPLTRRDVELTDRASVEAALSAVSASVVINAAAFNLVDDAEVRPAEAFAVNALGARELGLVCGKLGRTLVHFSTDYVFGLDDERRDPYEETDCPGPISVYAQSKLAGEYFVRSTCPRHFVVRTCGLYGHRGSGGKGRNFVETMLRLAGERRRVRVVHDQMCTPTFTEDLAAATMRLVATDEFGIHHWTNGGACSWHEFACEVFRRAGVDVECEPITSDEFGARARRPKYSVLSTRRWMRLGFVEPRPWPDALQDYLDRRAAAGSEVR
jgi:dTDP-4-dehydrorhamnose reductase